MHVVERIELAAALAGLAQGIDARRLAEQLKIELASPYRADAHAAQGDGGARDSSGGVGGRKPPSYQIRSNAPRSPRAGYWKRTMLAEGNEKSFFTPEAMPSVKT